MTSQSQKIQSKFEYSKIFGKKFFPEIGHFEQKMTKLEKLALERRSSIEENGEMRRSCILLYVPFFAL